MMGRTDLLSKEILQAFLTTLHCLSDKQTEARL